MVALTALPASPTAAAPAASGAAPASGIEALMGTATTAPMDGFALLMALPDPVAASAQGATVLPTMSVADAMATVADPAATPTVDDSLGELFASPVTAKDPAQATDDPELAALLAAITAAFTPPAVVIPDATRTPDAAAAPQVPASAEPAATLIAALPEAFTVQLPTVASPDGEPALPVAWQMPSDAALQPGTAMQTVSTAPPSQPAVPGTAAVEVPVAPAATGVAIPADSTPAVAVASGTVVKPAPARTTSTIQAPASIPGTIPTPAPARTDPEASPVIPEAATAAVAETSPAPPVAAPAKAQKQDAPTQPDQTTAVANLVGETVVARPTPLPLKKTIASTAEAPIATASAAPRTNATTSTTAETLPAVSSQAVEQPATSSGATPEVAVRTDPVRNEQPTVQAVQTDVQVQRPEAAAAPARSESTSAMRQPNPLERVVAQQVGRAIVRHLPDGGERVVIRLTPPELGTVRIEFTSRGGEMVARLVAEDEGVRQALDRALPQLRGDLKADNPRLDIRVDHSEQRWGWDQQQQQQQRGERQDGNPGQRRLRDDEPAFSLDGAIANDEPISTRAAPVLGGRASRSGVDALA